MEVQMQSVYDASVRDHRAEAELEALFDRHRQTGIVLQRIYPPAAFPRVRSRLGGLPQLPQAFEWPMGESYGEPAPMHFLAQIDCAELPRVGSPMPEQGMLFFFVVNDEEQIWDTDAPQQRARVLYAQEVPADQQERQPPAQLRPILDVVSADSPHLPPGWLLPGEDGPRVHVRWPLVARRMDTWPEEMPEAVSGMDWEAYHRRWEELRLGAAVAATGLMPSAERIRRWEQPLSHSCRFPGDWLRQQRDFPQAGILVDRLARFVGNARRRPGRTFVAHPDVLEWVDYARRLGWDKVPDEATRETFRHWLFDQVGDAPTETALASYEMSTVFTRGLLAAIAYAAAVPEVAQLFPWGWYRDLEGEHLPYRDSHRKHPDGRTRCAETRLHQMLGHVPSLHGMRLDEEEVCLLRLAYDPAIDLEFGDCGHATFWIARDDLAMRNFDRVVAMVESH
jgi:Uncharacterized protein conserved in bacteria